MRLHCPLTALVHSQPSSGRRLQRAAQRLHCLHRILAEPGRGSQGRRVLLAQLAIAMSGKRLLKR